MTEYKGFEQLVRKGVLDTIARHQSVLDDPNQDEALLEQAFKSGKQSENVKMVCARVSKPLAEQVTQAAAVCNVSQRKFVEQALQQAVSYVDEVSKNEGLDELMEQHSA